MYYNALPGVQHRAGAGNHDTSAAIRIKGTIPMLLTAATRTIAYNKARRVFFSFHYQNDLWRAQVVKNSWVTAENREGAGFWNASLETEAKTKGDAEIKQMIDEALIGCSVTAILIGSGTTPHKYVLYEIQKSYDEGKGLLGVRMHR